MRILLIGPPGAGKGTQLQRLLERSKIVPISTGDLLRSELATGTKLGVDAKRYIESGALVPDEIVLSMVRSKIETDDCDKNGFVLDGFPRTVKQAEGLDEILGEKKLNGVIEFVANEEILLERIIGRFSCANCGKIYNKSQGLKKNCDKCGSGNFLYRNDDKEETMRFRLETYKKESLPVREFYRKKDLLFLINGVEQIDLVNIAFDSIIESLNLK